MLAREDSIPKVNVYSSKILFEQMDNRNKKRIAQMLKRKTALSARNNNSKEREENKSPIKSPLVSKTNKKNDLLIINILHNNDIDNNIDNSDYDKDLVCDTKLESNETNKIKKNLIYDSTIRNLDFSPIISNNTLFHENNNYYNNSSTNNSNNNSLINRDSQEKEVNISNLENDSIDNIIINNENNNLEEDYINLNKDNDKLVSKSQYNYDHDDDNNILNKEERKIKEENEYAIKYLSSSSDSFVQLDNHLVAKAKAQGGQMTESYFQALFPELVSNYDKSVKQKNYEVSEIIKEEREFESPFSKNNYFTKKSSKISRISLDRNLTLKNGIFIDKVKKLKKSLVKAKSNFQLTNKNNKIKSDKNNELNTLNVANKKTLKGKKFKSVSNFKNIQKKIKNNNIKINKIKDKNEKEKLNISSSYPNINSKNVINNKLDLKIKSGTKLYSTFSSNLYKIDKTKYKSYKIIRNKENNKNTFNNILNDENDSSNVSLIINCVKIIGKSKNLKISKHYLKNINFYNNNKETSNKNKTIKKRNQNYNTNNLDSTLITNTLKLNSLNTTNFPRKQKYVLIKYKSKKNLNRNMKNYTNININTIKKINTNCNENKVNAHKNCISSFSLNESIKQKKQLTKKDRVKSFSRFILKKQEINEIINTEYNTIRRKTNHKKLNTLSNYETINTETSLMKTKLRKNNNFTNNIIPDKKKYIHFHKKIDYSYVKAKVETGLSEDILKKLLKNNKKLYNKEAYKNMDSMKKQSLLKKCKIGINKSIENFKTIASNIKKKLFKTEKIEKLNVNNNQNFNKNTKRKK